jgi:hypothetical protein
VFNVGTPDFWYDVIFKLRPTYELETELNTLITEDAERRLREEEQKRLEHQLRYLQRPSIVPLATEQTTSTNDVNEPTPESHQTLNNNGEHKGGTKNKGSEKKKKNKKTKQNQKKRKSRKMRK